MIVATIIGLLLLANSIRSVYSMAARWDKVNAVCAEQQNVKAAEVCLKNVNNPEFKVIDDKLFCNVVNAPREFFFGFDMENCKREANEAEKRR